jgi:hypothetical protein
MKKLLLIGLVAAGLAFVPVQRSACLFAWLSASAC